MAEKVFPKSRLFERIDIFDSHLELVASNAFFSPTVADYSSLDTYITHGIDASRHSLRGLRSLVEVDDYIDCFLLIRKIRDNIMLDAVLAYDAKYNHAALAKTIDFSSSEKTFDFIKEALQENSKFEEQNELKRVIRKWRAGRDDKRHWFSYANFCKQLKRDASLNELLETFIKDELTFLEKTTNSFVHANSVFKLEERLTKESAFLALIEKCLFLLDVLLISVFMLVDSALFRSEDYADYAEEGLTPPEGSQYWLAPCAESFLLEIRKYNSALFGFLRAHNTASMTFPE